jgi:hypothetical protein
MSKILHGPLPPPPKPGKDTDELFDRASRGDDKCYPLALALLADGERGKALVEGIGSVANCLRNRIVDEISGKDILLQAAIHQKLQEIWTCTAGPDPSQIEVLLAERIAICWLLVYRYELQYALALKAGSLNIKQAEWWQKKITMAHNRLMSAIVALAKVRRLAGPSLQQINLAVAHGPQLVNVNAENGPP